MQKQILIVEDNELNRAILCEILANDYQVLEAENGQEALDILQQSKESVALILLDIMMPVMDGYTFLDRLKDDAELSLIPVIVMTQNDREEDEVSALAHGATDFVPKPYRPQVLLHRVASLIRLRETAAMVNQFQYDRLTGLYSKEFFYEKVGKRLDENPEKEYSIVCSDIENFKLYNEIFGRQAGDRLLQEIAARSQEKIGKAGICGRYGADCFLFLQEREQERLDREHFLSNAIYSVYPEKMKNVSIKWGVYEISDRSIPVEKMCDRALLAVNSIKGKYNQYFAVYDDSLRSKLLREKTITDAMETALAEEQFVVYFQPKYSLNEDCMAGAEALVRWIHPEWGFMSPGEFIPLFEKNGFIPRLDQYVWERACRKLREWKEKGYPLLPISVNVSRADVYQANLVETLLELTQKYDVDPAYLHLEITESAYTQSPDQIISTVEELRKVGFIIEMDDFGSGYSSLNMLSQMKLDILKLDMKFIQNELAKPMEHCILNDVINMAHRMYLSTVAEGVETREQLERLRAIGCDYVQGYFLAKPMPAQEFEVLLKAQPVKSEAPSMQTQKKENDVRSLLVIDEDAGYRESVCRTFEGRYQVLEAADTHSALAVIGSREFDDICAIVLSMTLKEDGAASVLKTIQEKPVVWRIPVLATIPRCNERDNISLTQDADDFLCKCHPLADLRRRIDRLVEEVEYHKRECTMQEAANRDYMTGLLNRRGLQAAVASLRKEETPLAVCIFDLDGLKTVNDTLGHNVGDRMIQSFADLLRGQTQGRDILCRYGGDEFVAILKHMSDETGARKKCEEICRSFSNQLAAEEKPASCSAGVALCSLDGSTLTQWIDRADQAMYQAKQEGKGGCCIWSADL